MLGRVHHIGYVARDLNLGTSVLAAPYSLALVSELELPQFSLRAVFLSGAEVTIEVIEFTNPEIARQRLRGQDVRIDHMACTVRDLDAAIASLRAAGTRFCAPDGSALEQPLRLPSGRHIWTVPAAAEAVCLQLVEPSGPVSAAGGWRQPPSRSLRFSHRSPL